jgi:hypothetical protein
MGEAARQVRQTSPASACLHRGPTTKQNRSDPSNHAQTPRVEGSGIYFRSDCMRRLVPTRRLPLRDAGRGAAPVVCVAGCFPAWPALFAAAASSAIPFNLQLSACNQRFPRRLKAHRSFLATVLLALLRATSDFISGYHLKGLSWWGHSQERFQAL